MGTMTTCELLSAPGTQYRTMRYHFYWSGVSVSNDTRLLSLCQATETFLRPTEVNQYLFMLNLHFT